MLRETKMILVSLPASLSLTLSLSRARARALSLFLSLSLALALSRSLYHSLTHLLSLSLSLSLSRALSRARALYISIPDASRIASHEQQRALIDRPATAAGRQPRRVAHCVIECVLVRKECVLFRHRQEEEVRPAVPCVCVCMCMCVCGCV